MRRLSVFAAALLMCAAATTPPSAHATRTAPPPVEVASVYHESAPTMSDKPIPPAAPALYATMLPGLQEVARAHGYALAAHGSMKRDFDLIAVPWTADAAAPEVLADAIRDRSGGAFSNYDNNGSVTEKPHGRRCWCVHFGGGFYIDLSVMPRTEPPYVDVWNYVRMVNGSTPPVQGDAAALAEARTQFLGQSDLVQTPGIPSPDMCAEELMAGVTWGWHAALVHYLRCGVAQPDGSLT